MKPEELLKKYIDQCKMMQVASASNDQPWVCTVYYVVDEDYNLYWLSLPERRHSKEIANNAKTAITIPVEQDQPVVGIQAEGTASAVKDSDEIKKVMSLYADKYGLGHQFYDNFVAGKNKHLLYKFIPSMFVLFDEKDFDQEARFEINIEELTK